MAIKDFVKAHPDITMAGGLVVLVGVGAYLISKQSAGVGTGTPTTSTVPSGLTNGQVYVPTSTSFSTENLNKGTNIGNTTNNSSTTKSGSGSSKGQKTPTCKTGYTFSPGPYIDPGRKGAYPVNGGWCLPPGSATAGSPTPTPSPVPTCKVGYHFQSNKLGVPVAQGSYTTTGGYCVPDAVATPPHIVHKGPTAVPPTAKG
jgi:hypothetical protein